MPADINQWIWTEQGAWRLLVDEYARGTGVPKAWILDQDKVNCKTARQTTSINIWEATTASLANPNHHTTALNNSQIVQPTQVQPKKATPTTDRESPPDPE